MAEIIFHISITMFQIKTISQYHQCHPWRLIDQIDIMAYGWQSDVYAMWENEFSNLCWEYYDNFFFRYNFDSLTETCLFCKSKNVPCDPSWGMWRPSQKAKCPSNCGHFESPLIQTCPENTIFLRYYSIIIILSSYN